MTNPNHHTPSVMSVPTTLEVPTIEAEIMPYTSDASLANSTQRIQVVFNPRAWDHLPDVSEDDRGVMLWYLQRCLDRGANWEIVKAETDYDRTTMFRAFSGTLNKEKRDRIETGKGYRNIVATLRAMREAEITRGGFVPTRQSECVFSVLDYALACRSIGLIVGESRMGKTFAAREWCRRKGAAVATWVDAPEIGGYRALLANICQVLGVQHNNKSGPKMAMDIRKCFAPGRVLVIDEAGFIMPNFRQRSVEPIEILRRLHDDTGCAIVLLVTDRDLDRLVGGRYQYEQFLGRANAYAALPEFDDKADLLPLLSRWGHFGKSITTELLRLCRQPGRLGVVFDAILPNAQNLATQAGKPLSDAFVRLAIAYQNQHRIPARKARKVAD